MAKDASNHKIKTLVDFVLCEKQRRDNDFAALIKSMETQCDDYCTTPALSRFFSQVAPLFALENSTNPEKDVAQSSETKVSNLSSND